MTDKNVGLHQLNQLNRDDISQISKIIGRNDSFHSLINACNDDSGSRNEEPKQSNTSQRLLDILVADSNQKDGDDVDYCNILDINAIANCAPGEFQSF